MRSWTRPCSYGPCVWLWCLQHRFATAIRSSSLATRSRTGGLCHEYLTDLYLTRYPKPKIRFVNSDIGGDTANN